MDEMMGRTRFLGRAAVLGAATFAALLAAGTVADAAQASTAAPAHSVNFTLPAGANSVKLAAGSTQVVVTRASGVSPFNAIPCNLSVSNPTFSGSSVSTTGTIRCAYPTSVYLQVGLSFNGNTPTYKGQSFLPTYVDSLTVSVNAVPGYYQGDAIAILGDGEQYGTVYSSNVYIPQ